MIRVSLPARRQGKFATNDKQNSQSLGQIESFTKKGHVDERYSERGPYRSDWAVTAIYGLLLMSDLSLILIGSLMRFAEKDYGDMVLCPKFLGPMQ